jgi:hypothetical protein
MEFLLKACEMARARNVKATAMEFLLKACEMARARDVETITCKDRPNARETAPTVLANIFCENLQKAT